MPNQRPRLTVAAEAAGIISAIAAVAGLAFTIFLSGGLSGISANPSATKHGHSQRPAPQPTASPTPSASISPTPVRSHPQAEPSSSSTYSTPPVSQSGGSHTTPSSGVASATHPHRPLLNPQDKIGIAIGFGFAVVVPIFGLIIKMFGFRSLVNFYLFLALFCAALACYSRFVKPQPGDPFMYFVMFPIWATYFIFGLSIYFGIRSKMTQKAH